APIGQTLYSMRRSSIRLQWRLIARAPTTLLVAWDPLAAPGTCSRDWPRAPVMFALVTYIIIYVVNRLDYRKQRAEAQTRRVAGSWSRVRCLWHTRAHHVVPMLLFVTCDY